MVLVVYYRAFLVEPKQQGQMRMMGGGGPPPPPPAGQETVQVNTVAGRPMPGYQDGRGREVRFEGPAAVAVHPSGGVYVADSRNHRIRYITPEGQVTTVAGGGPAGMVMGGYQDGPALEARFWNPSGLALDRRGFLYVADSGNHCLRCLRPDGQVTTVAGVPGPPDETGLPSGGYRDGAAAAARFRSPGGLAFDGAGNLYIADVGNHCIRRLSPQGQVTTVAGWPGERDATGQPRGAFADGMGPQARFRSPTALACLPDGRLVVADAGNSCVRMITPEGRVQTLPLPHLEPPAGAADWEPPPIPSSGTPAPQGVRLLEPAGIAVDERQRIFVTDVYVNCIFQVDFPEALGTPSSSLRFQLVAGTYHEGSPISGHSDGNGARCAFARPAALACAPAGIIYVADFGNDCVRRVTVP